jgi:hypothetical protein
LEAPQPVSFLLKTLLAAVVIASASWLADKRPQLGGFLIALPLASMLALAFNAVEFQNLENTTRFAQSIFTAIPLSLLFFVPFLFAGKLNWSFWTCYLVGFLLLGGGFLIHRQFFSS